MIKNTENPSKWSLINNKSVDKYEKNFQIYAINRAMTLTYKLYREMNTSTTFDNKSFEEFIEREVSPSAPFCKTQYFVNILQAYEDNRELVGVFLFKKETFNRTAFLTWLEEYNKVFCDKYLEILKDVNKDEVNQFRISHYLNNSSTSVQQESSSNK